MYAEKSNEANLQSTAMTTPFTVLIPARLGSTRLPNKPLLTIGNLPMVVRVARQAQQSRAARVYVATDSLEIVAACQSHQVQAVLTDTEHVSGSDRLAQACKLLGLQDQETVVNVQGDEPLIAPELINAVADLLHHRPDCAMSTAAHPMANMADFLNPNVVKVVLDAKNTALYFSRAPIPAPRNGQGQAWWQPHPQAQTQTQNQPNTNPTPPPLWPAPLRHVGIYGYRVEILRHFPQWPPAPMEHIESLEQLRALWHGHRIAVHICTQAPGPGVDTAEDLARVRASLGQD